MVGLPLRDVPFQSSWTSVRPSIYMLFPSIVRMSIRGIFLPRLPHKMTFHKGVILPNIFLNSLHRSANMHGGFLLRDPKNSANVVPLCMASTFLNSSRSGICKASKFNRAMYSPRVLSLLCLAMNLPIKVFVRYEKVLMFLVSKLLNLVNATLVKVVGNTLHNKASEWVYNSMKVL